MAGFTTLAIIGAATAGFSAFQQYRAGKSAEAAGEAQQRAAEASAELSEYNAQVAELQAADALERGAQEEHRFRAGVRGLIGAQRAGFAASNLDVGFGSALDVQADAAFLGEIDALQIRTNAAREAWGYKVEAVDLRHRARIAREEGVMLAEAGRQQRNQAWIGAGTTLLSAGASLLQNRYGRMTGRATATPLDGTATATPIG